MCCLKIAIAGATGFIGKHLLDYYLRNDDVSQVIIISRSKHQHRYDDQRMTTVTWKELEHSVKPLEALTAIINLAGESINQRWTAAAKERILHSRLHLSQQLAQIIDRLEVKPGVLVNASGMSIYGTSETDTYDERSPSRITDFLAEVVEQWEQAIDQTGGVRIVKLRVGVVLGNHGGAFPKMALPYRLGVGGRIGSGRQWISWIHVADMVRLIDYCVRHTDVEGAVNATAPHPVRNDEFGRALGKAMRRPHYFPVPALMFRLIFGELSVLLLEGQKVIPQVLLDHGFQYEYPTIDQAMQQLVGRDEAKT